MLSFVHSPLLLTIGYNKSRIRNKNSRFGLPSLDYNKHSPTIHTIKIFEKIMYVPCLRDLHFCVCPSTRPTSQLSLETPSSPKHNNMIVFISRGVPLRQLDIIFFLLTLLLHGLTIFREILSTFSTYVFVKLLC